jgi:hypothetical protein
MAESKPFLIDSEARARATGGKEMKLTECGNMEIHDYFKLNEIKSTEDAKKHLLKRFQFQPERLSEREQKD